MKSISDVKTSILQSIANCDDERLLVDSFIKKLQASSTQIVGYSSAGQPLTAKDYQTIIEEARADYKSGRTVQQEDMEREA